MTGQLEACSAHVLTLPGPQALPRQTHTAGKALASVRTMLHRYTRLTNAHSKSWRHHVAMTALFVARYNFCRKHETFRGQTPAMASGLTEHVWTIKELLQARKHEALATSILHSHAGRRRNVGLPVFWILGHNAAVRRASGSTRFPPKQRSMCRMPFCCHSRGMELVRQVRGDAYWERHASRRISLLSWFMALADV
jgi:hypothetical protein